MQRRSFLHPDYAYTISKTRNNQQTPPLQAPDIFVVPPEEDQTPPWCCYNSQHGLADDDDDDEYSLRYPQASSHTPYFHRDTAGLDGLILPSSKGSSETRSIVDALGDADDFSDHEPMDMDPDEEDDGIVPEMETGYRRTRHDRHFHQEFGVQRQLRPLLPEADNDSDIVEIVKVRRKSAFINDPNNMDIFAPSNNFGSKATLRSRASKAFQSLRGSLRTSSKTASKHMDLGGSLSHPKSKYSMKLQPKPKSQLKPRAQDIFSPIENVPQPKRSQTPDLLRRPPSRISEFFTPTLKRRASTNSFIFSKSKQPAPTPDSQEPLPQSSRQKPSSRPSNGSATLPGRTSSSARTHQELTNPEQGEVPTPTRNDYRRRSEDDHPTPTGRSSGSQNPPRSISPSPAPRVNSPPPGNRQAKKGFSVLNLHKIFQKSAPQTSPDVGPRPTRQASSGSSVCPSLSSTPTSEWSGRTSPTVDSVPQTPTNFDENEVRRTIVPVQSTSSVGSGISFGSSLQSGAVSLMSSSSISSEATTATPGHHPNSITNDPPESGAAVQKDSFSYDGTTITGSESQQPRPSVASSRSTVSTYTVGGVGSSASGRVSESTISRSMVSPSPEPELDMTLQLDLDLDLGLSINMAPSASGGMLSSNGMGSAAAGSTIRKTRGRSNRSRSLSLKDLGNKLGIGKPDVPPVPLLPEQNGAGDAGDFEMRLDSLHFDEMSFDADRFIGIAH